MYLYKDLNNCPDHLADADVVRSDPGKERDGGGAQFFTRLSMEDTLYGILSVLLCPETNYLCITLAYYCHDYSDLVAA